MNRLANPFIASGGAGVPVHGLRDFLIARIRGFRQHRRRRHNLPGLAISALRNFFGNPCLLQHVQAVRAEPFNRRNTLPGNLRHWSRARPYRGSLHMYRASPAESGAASELGSREFQRVSQHPEQRSLRRDAHFFLATVNAQCEVGHRFSEVEFATWTIILLNLREKWNGLTAKMDSWDLQNPASLRKGIDDKDLE